MSSINKKKTRRYLLDTHAFVWWMDGGISLDRKVADILSDPDHEIFVSTASLWELSIKASIGKIILPKGISIAQSIQAAGFQLLDIKAGHMEMVAGLKQFHKDPFDHLLVCQAEAENLVLITHDKMMNKYLAKGQLLMF